MAPGTIAMEAADMDATADMGGTGPAPFIAMPAAIDPVPAVTAPIAIPDRTGIPDAADIDRRGINRPVASVRIVIRRVVIAGAAIITRAVIGRAVVTRAVMARTIISGPVIGRWIIAADADGNPHTGVGGTGCHHCDAGGESRRSRQPDQILHRKTPCYYMPIMISGG